MSTKTVGRHIATLHYLLSPRRNNRSVGLRPPIGGSIALWNSISAFDPDIFCVFALAAHATIAMIYFIAAHGFSFSTPSVMRTLRRKGPTMKPNCSQGPSPIARSFSYQKSSSLLICSLPASALYDRCTPKIPNLLSPNVSLTSIACFKPGSTALPTPNQPSRI